MAEVLQQSDVHFTDSVTGGVFFENFHPWAFFAA
jgi:hypothetical protein